jgi:hypothetical protein
MFDLWVTENSPRIPPACRRCGMMMTVTRIEPHPDGEFRALLCSYECPCGEKIGQKEC